jgi:hypothetical protein
MDNNSNRWYEGPERREVRRRYTSDRRNWERKKYYLSKMLVPIVASVLFAGLISWGAYVTHTTYTISANYEQTFKKALDGQTKRRTFVDGAFDKMRDDYEVKVFNLREELREGLHETRVALSKIYNLLVTHEQRRVVREDEIDDRREKEEDN